MRLLSRSLLLLSLFFAAPAFAAECTAPSPELLAIGNTAPPLNLEIDTSQDYAATWQYINTHYYDVDKLKEINFDSWEHKYDGQLKDTRSLDKALMELFGALHENDQYTNYYQNGQRASHQSDRRHGVVESGLGLNRHKDGKVYLETISFGTAAYYAPGLTENVTVRCLNHIDISSLNNAQLYTLTHGRPGEGLTVTATIHGAEQDLKLDYIKPVENTEAQLLPGNVGYVRLPHFETEKPLGTLLSEVSDLIDKAGGDLDKLEVDLRNDRGGESDVAQKFVSLFFEDAEHTEVFRSFIRARALDDKPVYGLERTHMFIDGHYVDEKVLKVLKKVKLVVLINGSSASAAEISTGALKDHKRATIIGTRSFGKDLGFTTFKGPYGSGIQLSEMTYLTPSGYSPHGNGIHPDYVVAMPSDRTKSDPQRDAGANFLNFGHL